jgi:hypothetical protein
MAVTPNSVVTPQALNTSAKVFTEANAATKQNLVTTGANGTLIRSVTVATNNSADRQLNLFYYTGTTATLLASVTVPDLSGSDGGTNPVKNALNTTDFPGLPLDANENPYLWVAAGHSIQAAFDANMAAGKTANVNTLAEDL